MISSLLPFGHDIWIADGPVVPFVGGFAYSTRMAAIRLGDGGLFIWSPVALSTDLKREIDALGPVRCLISPNLLHHLFLGEWKAAYPQARMFAAPGLRRRRKDLAFNADLTEQPASIWAGEIDQALLRGSFLITEAVFFHRNSGAALFADLIQNFPPDWFKGWRGVLARLDGIVAPQPGAPREWRASFLRRAQARRALRQILDWPIERVVIAHGNCVENDSAAFVRRAFLWLI